MEKKKKFKVVILVAAVFLCGIIYLISGSGRLSPGESPDVFVAGEPDVEGEDGASVSTDGSADQQVSTDGSADRQISTDGSSDQQTGGIYVYICGAVKKPGVYTFDDAPRVVDVVEKAGGFTKKADTLSVNLAGKLDDGSKVVIYEKDRKHDAMNADAAPQATDAGSGISDDVSGTIDINTAGEDELMQIPGIGKVRAASIVAYRNDHGFFARTEDIMQVSGIGQATYDSMKEHIRV
ncbi:MAG: helix-hairpin-helix domain-containing protein [Eubacterium sp.]|nr:helix-hairpin-helix domain-containing protein [Eubacterium sp.]